MKAVELQELGKQVFVEKATPVPQAGEVLIQVKACGICGSDIPRTFITGAYHFPTVLGHELAGKIVSLGKNVASSLLGKKAAIFPLIPCGKCQFCQSAYYAQCENYDYFGSRRDGGFQEYLAVPVENLVILADHITYEEGAMVEPATVAQHVVNKAGVTLGDQLVIYGAGPIGLMVAQWAEINGANRVVLVDIDQKKVEFAKQLGFHYTINSQVTDVSSFLMEAFSGKKADIAIEATGSSIAFNSCVESITTFGKVILLGNPHSDMSLTKATYDQLMRKEGKILGMFNSVWEHFPKNEWSITAEYIANHKLKLRELVTHHVPLECLPEAFDMIYQKKEFYCKVLVHYE